MLSARFFFALTFLGYNPRIGHSLWPWNVDYFWK